MSDDLRTLRMTRAEMCLIIKGLSEIGYCMTVCHQCGIVHIGRLFVLGPCDECAMATKVATLGGIDIVGMP